MIPIPPSWYVAGGIGAAAVLGIGWQEIQKSGLRADIADLRVELADSRTAIANVTANRDHLVSEVERQNSAIEAWKRIAEAQAAETGRRLMEALRAADKKREIVAKRPGIGPQEMNRWLLDYFPPR